MALRATFSWLAISALACTAACASCRSGPGASGATGGGDAAAQVALPGGAGGIGFDDLVFAAGIRKVVAPAAATGNLDLVDPDSLAVTAIGGFSTQQGNYTGGHDYGVTTADEGRGLLFATDRTSQLLDVVDPNARAIVGSAKLGASPDYARWVEATGEVWVTEPDAETVEIFTVPAGDKPTPVRAASISVKGGPESLVVDATRKKAFTHLWSGATVAIDVTARAVLATWPNGCQASRGIAVDAKHGWLFAGCAEGSLSVLDVDHDGKMLGTVSAGGGVDVIAFSGALAHVYVPGSSSATMAIIGFAPSGAPSVLGTVATASGAHCVAADDRAQAWVCDPQGGRLLVYKDTF